MLSNDQAVRRLTTLEQSASTARVLNLVAVHRKHGDAPELTEAPFFKNRVLDRCIVLKHRLRPNEFDHFDAPRANATKLLVPIDPTDLRLGARFLFVGQRGWDEALTSLTGVNLKAGAPDRTALELIDDLPSLDPFLLREHLKQHGIEPARAYFALSDADIDRMYQFVLKEVMSLVTLSTPDRAAHLAAARLVDKLLSKAADTDFALLKQTLKLSDREYQDGIFCWRGFLYYKWIAADLLKPIQEVAAEISRIQPRGARDPEAAAYLPEARGRICNGMALVYGRVKHMLAVYDRAYQALTRDGEPAAFRDFLLSAPGMFSSLGEQLGAVQHVVSFWRYRFPPGRPGRVTPAELMDIFTDFEDGVGYIAQDAQAARAA